MTESSETIGVGSEPNDGTGDALRTAGGKINRNFARLDPLTTGVFLYLGFHGVTIPAGSSSGEHRIVNADLTTLVDAAGLWDSANDRIVVPVGYTRALAIFNAGCPSAAGSFTCTIEIGKNGFAGTGNTSEPMVWANTMAGIALARPANAVQDLEVRDAVTAGDTFRMHIRQESGASQTAVGNLLFRLFP